MLAVVAIFLGALVVGFNSSRWDTVIVNLPKGTGIHLNDVIGMALITSGVLVLCVRNAPHNPLR